jgi:hypothetical protein
VDLLLHVPTSNAAEQAAGGHGADDDLVAVLRSAPGAGAYPRITGLGVRWRSGSGSDRRRWAFRVLINGVIETPVPPTG